MKQIKMTDIKIHGH